MQCCRTKDCRMKSYRMKCQRTKCCRTKDIVYSMKKDCRGIVYTVGQKIGGQKNVGRKIVWRRKVLGRMVAGRSKKVHICHSWWCGLSDHRPCVFFGTVGRTQSALHFSCQHFQLAQEAEWSNICLNCHRDISFIVIVIPQEQESRIFYHRDLPYRDL